MTLLEETKQILQSFNKNEEDIIWCGSEEYGYFTWKDFKAIANIDYDSGFGSAQVAEDLVICGKDFWLERDEYDGAESWNYKTIPLKPTKKKTPTALTIQQATKRGLDLSCGWENLKRLNN